MTLFKDDINKNKLIINEYFSTELKNVLNKLLCKDKNEKFNNIDEIKKHIFFKNIDWIKIANMEIVPPINLVKNRKENCNKIGFKKKSKNEKKDYFLDFNIVTKFQNIQLIRKYVENKTSDNNPEKNGENDKLENNQKD